MPTESDIFSPESIAANRVITCPKCYDTGRAADMADHKCEDMDRRPVCPVCDERPAQYHGWCDTCRSA